MKKPVAKCNESGHHIIRGFCYTCCDSETREAFITKLAFHNTDGSKTSFYDCKGCNDVDDLAEHWGMKFDEANCLKALVGIAKGSRHDGTTPLRDAKKLIHYANRILKRLENKDESK